MSMDPEAEPMLRIAKLIKDKTEGKNKVAINRLRKDINEANILAGGEAVIYNQMLTDLRDGKGKQGITKTMLIALCNYFPELKYRPPFVIPDLYEVMLMDAPKIVFMLGAIPRQKDRRDDISHWDVQALAEMLPHCSKQDSHRKFDIQTVRWRERPKMNAIAAEDWYRVLEVDEASVVSIGSPLVSLASEVMLARMFGREPFDSSPNNKFGLPLPFHFAWRPNRANDFQSAFSVTPQELQSLDAAIATEVRYSRASAFVLEGKVHKVPVEGEEWLMHGVIAAQRRASGNVWLVISGMAGPATSAAAAKVKNIMEELPWAKGQPSKVLWVPVTVIVRSRGSSPHQGDGRDPTNADFNGPVRYWPA